MDWSEVLTSSESHDFRRARALARSVAGCCAFNAACAAAGRSEFETPGFAECTARVTTASAERHGPRQQSIQAAGYFEYVEFLPLRLANCAGPL